MRKKLAIIGANAAIAMLIDKAKALGYETHVFAWKCGDPGEAIADCFYPISIEHKERILDKCHEIGGIEGVCSITSDFAAPVVNYVANGLGLTCNPSDTNSIARDKFLMRSAFRNAGLYTPQFVVTGKNFSGLKLESFQFPVIVKPTDRWSSKGVTRVDTPAELYNAVTVAVNASITGQAIIEEFMEGPEYSAECICFHGEKHILAFTQKETTGYPHYIESGHYQPARLSSKDGFKASAVINRALDVLGIINGAAHAEFKLLKNGEVGLIEIGARMGGDCIGTDLTPIATGMDYIRMVIDVACGNKPDLTVKSVPHSAMIKYIITENDYYEYQRFKESHKNQIVREGEFDTNFMKTVQDSSTRHGYFIIKGDRLE